MDQKVLTQITNRLNSHGLTVIGKDLERPWGGFLVLDESQIESFVHTFFPGLELPPPQDRLPMSPKILIVAPNKRLSWQYHNRRGEVWMLINGTAGVVMSPTDDQDPLQELQMGTRITLEPNMRHRLVGLEDWGVVAEIWMHTDPKEPSDENDIVRVQDDFDRK